jgi:ribose transport system ATP-binding protein
VGGSVRDAIVSVEDVSKTFGRTRALAGVSLDLRAGEVHCLLGENGAGKSTLGKIIGAVHAQDAGRVVIDGEAVDLRGVADAARRGIAVVFQELSLPPHLSVADNLLLGSERARHPFARLRRSEERERCRRVLRELELEVDLDRETGTLSVAQRQLLEVAKALIKAPRVVVMDEPTAMLTHREKESLFRAITRLKQRGIAFLYVTHHLHEVLEIGSRVTIMKDGAVTATLDVDETLDVDRLLGLLTGRKATEFKRPTPPGRQAPVLRLESVAGGGVREVSLEIHPGEIVGVYGVVGCGREDLARMLVGISRPERGDIRLGGQPYRPPAPSQALARGIGYLPMGRKDNGILPNRPIRENLNLTGLPSFAAFGFVSNGRERRRCEETLRRFRVKFDSMEAPITSLSGGNQQKVLLGRVMSRSLRLLILEDPTAGIDVGARLDIYEQIKRKAEEGVGVLLLSCDLPETLMLCHRVLTMYGGRIVREYVDPGFDHEQDIVSDILGKRSHPQPVAAFAPGAEAGPRPSRAGS